MNNQIAFTTTALNRPDVIDKTYESFSKNIKNLDLSMCTLYINIDPIPNDKLLCGEVLEVARKYFGNVVYRTPDKPNFTSAVNYCWDSVCTPYIFHIEDDWLLITEIDMNEIGALLSNDTILEVVLRAYQYKYHKLVLSPSIWKYELYKVFAGQLKTDINPEVQLRDERFSKYFNTNSIVVLGTKPIVKDIGRKWLSDKNLIKPVKGKFVKY